jgi:hypothetical protein
MRRYERWTVLDRVHRIAKAMQLGRREIAAYVLAESDLAIICRR